MYGRGDTPSGRAFANQRYSKYWKWLSVLLLLSIIGLAIVERLGAASEGDTQERSLDWAREFIEDKERILCVKNVDGNTFFWIGGERTIKVGHRIWVRPSEDYRVSSSFLFNGKIMGIPGDQFEIVENDLRHMGEMIVVTLVQRISISAAKGYRGVMRFSEYSHPGLKPTLTEQSSEELPVVALCDF